MIFNGATILYIYGDMKLSISIKLSFIVPASRPYNYDIT